MEDMGVMLWVTLKKFERGEVGAASHKEKKRQGWEKTILLTHLEKIAVLGFGHTCLRITINTGKKGILS